jgi:hypothetical protein
VFIKSPSPLRRYIIVELKKPIEQNVKIIDKFVLCFFMKYKSSAKKNKANKNVPITPDKSRIVL